MNFKQIERRIYLFFLCLSLSSLGFGQAPPTSFSLEEYTPQITVQDGANCFAYASAYVALTTQYAFSHRQKPDSAHAYSFGFVDGAISYLGADNVRQAAYELWKGDIRDYGNLDNALYILVKYGTITFNKFPYTLEDDIDRHFTGDMLTAPTDLKISGINELITPTDYHHNDAILFKLQTEIAKGHPIICAIKELTGRCDQNFVRADPWRIAPAANHIVNVIGYNTVTRTLTVKNNFKKDCVFEVPLDRFCNALSWAYVLVIDESRK